jgi:hypothetical protein
LPGDTPGIKAIAGKAEERLIRYNDSQGKLSPLQHIKHVESSSRAAFKLTRLSDGKSLSPVAVGSPYVFDAQPNTPLAFLREGKVARN